MAKIAELFPEVVAEEKVNFDLLRSMLCDDVLGDEVYEFTWVGNAPPLPKSGDLYAKHSVPAWKKARIGIQPRTSIEGDNLDVLKLLQESYLGAYSARGRTGFAPHPGKVKMIYIEKITSSLI